MPTNSCFRSTMAAESKAMWPALNPNSFARRIVKKRLADSIKALLGMHPRRIQSPPTCSPPSRQTVFNPDFAATEASEYPALPPPITTKSKVCIAATSYRRFHRFQFSLLRTVEEPNCAWSGRSRRQEDHRDIREFRGDKPQNLV